MRAWADYSETDGDENEEKPVKDSFPREHSIDEDKPNNQRPPQRQNNGKKPNNRDRPNQPNERYEQLSHLKRTNDVGGARKNSLGEAVHLHQPLKS